MYQAGSPVKIRALCDVEQGRDVLKVALVAHAHQEVAETLGYGIGGGGGVVGLGSAERVNCAEEEVVLFGGFRVKDAVEEGVDLACGLDAGGFGDA